MADDADRADMSIESVIDWRVSEATRKAASIPAGEPGDCDFCGEWSGRLVNGACSPCRDRRGLA